MGPVVSYTQQVSRITTQVSVLIDPARRPSYFDCLDMISRAQAKVKSGVGGRLVASSADPPGDLLTATCLEHNFSANGIAV
jgi:hypothetical protein